MPLDPRIAMGFQSPQFESPVNMMGNMMKLKSMQQQNALAEQQMADLTTQRNSLSLQIYMDTPAITVRTYMTHQKGTKTPPEEKPLQHQLFQTKPLPHRDKATIQHDVA
jgi:hypothetical protein